MVYLLVDIPMHNQGFNPAIQTESMWWAGMITILYDDPDSLFELVQADGRRDGHGCVVGIAGPCHQVGDAVLDRKGDFVGGERQRVLDDGGSVHVTAGCRVV